MITTIITRTRTTTTTTTTATTTTFLGCDSIELNLVFVDHRNLALRFGLTFCVAP